MALTSARVAVFGRERLGKVEEVIVSAYGEVNCWVRSVEFRGVLAMTLS